MAKKKYNAIKLKLGKISLSSYRKKNTRKAVICSLDRAKSVGITFVVNERKELEAIKTVVKLFADKNIATYALGYIPEKKADDFYLSQQGFNFFYDKELDFFLQPRSEAAVEFMNQRFDILIDLNSMQYFPMQQLIERSKAGYRVGQFNEDQQTPFDMMINADPKLGTKYFAEQVIHYLKMINY